MSPRSVGNAGHSREVLEFDHEVRAVSPPSPDGYWRLRWMEEGRRRDTSARTREEAIAKATDLVERLGRGTPTALARATGADLVAHYLDPARRPPRVESWSERHRDEQARYCRLYVLPAIGHIPCRKLTRADFLRVVRAAPTASVGTHLTRCVTALVNAGLEEGYLSVSQDLLRGVRWRPAEGEVKPAPADRAITEAEIPTAAAVAALAEAAAEITGVWWRGLEILLVAYSGMRWGEHVALTADRVDPTRRRLVIDRQMLETRSGLQETLPKGRRRRVTMYPAAAPAGADLAEMVDRRLAELGPEDVVFPAPRGGWERRSNYGRNIWDPAATRAGWPRAETGRWIWTFHSLRHVFATWALNQPGLRLEDVSRLMGHSSVRVTQEVYIHVNDDLYGRFYAATG